MSLRDALGIAIPVLALVMIAFVPGEPRWLRRPWFMSDKPPRRAVLAVPFVAILLIDLARLLL